MTRKIFKQAETLLRTVDDYSEIIKLAESKLKKENESNEPRKKTIDYLNKRLEFSKKKKSELFKEFSKL